MNLFGAAFVTLGLVFLIFRLDLVGLAKQAISTSREAMNAIGDDDLSDSQKEQFVQACSLRLFKLLIQSAIGFACALFIPLGIVWAAHVGGLVDFDRVIDILLSWDFILISSIAGIAAYFFLNKWL